MTVPAKTKTITMVLPPGRYLKEGEKVAVGDMRIWSDDKPSIFCCVEDCLTSCHNRHLGEKVEGFLIGYIYRPAPKPKEPKYRFLKGKEIVKKGDQFYSESTKKWGLSHCEGEAVSYDPKDAETLSHDYRRRLHVKKG